MVATAPHYALEQAQDAAHGGEGWRSRETTTADELGSALVLLADRLTGSRVP